MTTTPTDHTPTETAFHRSTNHIPTDLKTRLNEGQLTPDYLRWSIQEERENGMYNQTLRWIMSETNKETLAAITDNLAEFLRELFIRGRYRHVLMMRLLEGPTWILEQFEEHEVEHLIRTGTTNGYVQARWSWLKHLVRSGVDRTKVVALGSEIATRSIEELESFLYLTEGHRHEQDEQEIVQMIAKIVVPKAVQICFEAPEKKRKKYIPLAGLLLRHPTQEIPHHEVLVRWVLDQLTNQNAAKLYKQLKGYEPQFEAALRARVIECGWVFATIQRVVVIAIDGKPSIPFSSKHARWKQTPSMPWEVLVEARIIEKNQGQIAESDCVSITDPGYR